MCRICTRNVSCGSGEMVSCATGEELAAQYHCLSIVLLSKCYITVRLERRDNNLFRTNIRQNPYTFRMI